MGNELKNKILEHDGIISEKEFIRKPSIQSCPRCNIVNAFENKYCSKCSYPLKPEAFEEIKKSEEARFLELEIKYKQEMNTLKVNMEKKIEQILAKIDLVKMN